MLNTHYRMICITLYNPRKMRQSMLLMLSVLYICSGVIDICWFWWHPCVTLMKTPLPHWGRAQMAALFQTKFSNAFSWMVCMYFDWDFMGVCSQGSHQHQSSIDSDNGFAPTKRKVTIWTNDHYFWRIYASPSLNELKVTKCSPSHML